MIYSHSSSPRDNFVPTVWKKKPKDFEIRLTRKAQGFLIDAANALGLSARYVNKIMQDSQTLADLHLEDDVLVNHVEGALALRTALGSS